MDTHASPRLTWVDVARGIGIIFVVLGHAAGGLLESSVGKGAEGIRMLFLAIYSFHMPLFFFLAGLFIAERVKQDPQKFLANAVGRTARSYLTWSVIQFSVIYMMGNLLNHPVDGPFLPRVIAILWDPVSQFWFLYVLFVYQILAWLLIPRTGPLPFLGCLVVLYLYTAIVGLPAALTRPLISQICVFGLSFGLGVAAGPHLHRLKLPTKAPGLIPIAAALLWAATCYAGILLSNQRFGAGWEYTDRILEIINGIIFLPAAVAGTAIVLSLSMISTLPLKAALEYLGRHSLPIFLTHVLFVAGSRIFILKLLGNVDAIVLLPIISILGIAGSLAFYELMKRLKLVRAFALI